MSVEISFGLVDVTAKQDTTATTADKQPWNDPQDLSLEGVYAPKVATLEDGYWKLDGTFDVFPDNPEDVSWGYWSKSMSDANGAFVVPPVLDLTFAANHSHIALTLEMDPHGDNYCDQIHVAWYHDATLLHSGDYQPDKWRYVLEQQVENYNRIVLTFNHTARPYRYVKLQNVMHGELQVWGGNDLKSASILEEVDLTSAELSINTLEFLVKADDDRFDLLNPTGIYSLLQKKQQFQVEIKRGGVMRNMGTYYLDTWETPTAKQCSMQAVDGIGVMEGTTFYGGLYTGVTAAVLVSEIMDNAGFGYSLDSSLRDAPIYGWLPICSHREALQQVALAIGAYVDTSRSGSVNIRPQPDGSPASTLTRNRKHDKTKVKLRTLVTGVVVTAHSYVLGSSSEQLFSDALDVGTHEILFDAPAANLTVSGATITASNVNRAVVSVAAAGTVTISGQRYTDNTVSVAQKMADLPAGEKENLVRVEGATLVGPHNVAAVAGRIYAYYQRRVQQEMQFVLDAEAVGTTVSIETAPGVYRDAVIESLDIDLTGGLVAKAVVAGA